MATKRKAKAANQLLAAIEFISLADHSKGSEHMTHCRVAEHCAVAFDGMIAVGTPIEEDLDACPHTSSLALALARCTDQFTITQLAADRLQIRSGEFLGFVPCCDGGKLPDVTPDAPLATLSDALTHSLRIVGGLANSKAQTVVAASVLIRAGSATATDRIVILESWHGCDLPPMMVPKIAVEAIVKAGKKLTQFGYSGNTATFWFEDNSWIKSQLYREDWPDVASILDAPSEPRSVPKQFFEAVKRVAPFSGDGNVYCTDSLVSSHPDYKKDVGGQLTIQASDGLQKRVYNAKSLLNVAKYARTFDENAHDHATLFYGDKIRGAIFHMKILPPLPPLPPLPQCTNPNCDGTCEVCLPF